MNKAYNPSENEDKILKKWKEKNTFLAKRKNESKTGKSFTVPIPPPNVTGQLHLGHAMMLVIQDIMTRYHRMKGDAALWLPGTDHAAIATESVVLKNLGVSSREEFTREEFLEKCFDHTKKTHATITNQVKKMGASCDFTRERYTMDLGLSNAVWKIFKDLYEQGLIVRGYRMVNWSTAAQSVLADDELEYEDQKDSFAYIRCGKFVMGTVRSETKCADSPLVIHPEEKYVVARYSSPSMSGIEGGEIEKYTPSNSPFKGENFSEEFIFSEVLFDDTARRNKIFNQLDPNGTWEKISVHQGKEFEGEEFEYETYAGKRKFFVLCDDEVIDINKGTGAMTISVNHSADDYLLAKKYPEKLKDYYFEKIGFDGKMTALAGELEGDDVKKARKRAVKIMLEKNLIVGLEKDYTHNVPLCYRTGCVVEPMISPQWFIDVNKEFDWQENVGVMKNYNPVFVFGKSEAEGGNIALPYFIQEDENIDYIKKSDELACKFTVFVENSEKADYRFRFFYPGGVESKLCGHALLGAAYKCEKQSFTVETNSGIYPVRKEDGKVFVKLSKVISITPDFSENFPAELVGLDEKNIIERGILSSGKEKFYIQVDSFENLQNIQYDFEGLKKWNEGKNFYGYIFYAEENGQIYARASNPLENINEDAACLTGVSSLSYFHHQPFSVEMGEGVGFDNILHIEHEEDGVWVGGNVFVKNSRSLSLSKDEADSSASTCSASGANNFIFIRHGESEDNAKQVLQDPKSPLTEKGRTHAHRVFEEIKGRKISKIISSPITRALETAEIIAKNLGLEVETLEYFSAPDNGIAVGTPKSEILPLAPLEYSEKMGTGEGYKNFFSRVEKGVSQLKNLEKQEGNILVIGHRSVLSTVDAILDGGTLEDAAAARRNSEGASHGIWGERVIQKSGKIFLARHGETTANADKIYQGTLDFPLNNKGKDQAKELAEKVKKEGITKIFTSSLSRAKETGGIIGTELGITPEVFADIQEVNVGILQGTPVDEFEGNRIEKIEALYTNEKSEGLENIEARAKKFIDSLADIQQKFPNENILFIGHNQFWTFVLSVLDGKTKDDFIEIRSKGILLDNCELKEINSKLKTQNLKLPIKTSLKKLTYDAVLGENPGVKLIPSRFEKIYHQWIDNLQDWCISRQIWWGHQIPIWYDDQGNEHVAHEQKLLFARHGESEDNANDIIGGDSNLTEKGRSQAKELGEKLIHEKRNIVKIYHSTLKRSKETAQIVLDQLKKENPTISLELEEFPDFHEVYAGDFENQTRIVEEKYPHTLHKMLDVKTGENMQDLEARAKKFWERVSKKGSENGDILFISHRTFLSMVFGVKDGCTADNLLAYRDRWEMDKCELREVNWMMPPANAKNLRQDEDTLDTWFSSALWPFSTLGWPDKTPDFENFFPTSVLETGHDILFFWVARMIMFSRFATGKNPFSDVYLHGLVCDEHGKKMSKSKGNGIDPLEMIEKYGTDALRMSMVVGNTPGNQVNLGEKKIEGYRNFANKLWNISRYILSMESNNARGVMHYAPTTLPEQWIVSKLQTLILDVSDGIENHKYGEVGQKLYDFTWNDLADWAIESAKAVESETIGDTLRYLLENLLKLLQPYMPFVTEKIWEEMGENSVLMLEDFPISNSKLKNLEAEEKFEILQSVIGKIRSLRSASKVDPVKKIRAVLNGENIEFLKENEKIISLLARLETLEFGEKPDEECVEDIASGTQIFLPLAGMLDMEKEAARKEKELEEAKAQLKNLEGRLANKSYIENAPDHLVQQTKDQYEEVKEKIKVLEG